MGAMVGEEFVEAARRAVLKPRGIPHAFWNAGEEEVRLLEIISPGGFERYFAEIAPLLAAGLDSLGRSRRATAWRWIQRASDGSASALG